MSSEHDENAQSGKPQWQKKIVSAKGSQGTVDPLASYQGKPILGQHGPNQSYVGRVVVELWEKEQPVDDYQGLVFTADAADGNHGALLRRIASALFERVQKGQTF